MNLQRYDQRLYSQDWCKLQKYACGQQILKYQKQKRSTRKQRRGQALTNQRQLYTAQQVINLHRISSQRTQRPEIKIDSKHL